jgi:His/Glu/Gln/Arg/opine family amino acid ABC transporter permease subunit
MPPLRRLYGRHDMGGLDLSFVSWDIISKFVLKGLIFSIELTIVATLGGILFGTLLALMRLSGRKALMLPATIYVNGMRSVPLVMVILWFYLLVPLLIGRPIGAELSAVVTFIAFEAAYFSEIMRAGIQSIPRGQVFAGQALGMTYSQNMRLGGSAPGLPQHAAGAADADHHPVSGHVAGLCHWRLRPAQGIRDGRQNLWPAGRGLPAGGRRLLCHLLRAVLHRQAPASQDRHHSLRSQHD